MDWLLRLEAHPDDRVGQSGIRGMAQLSGERGRVRRDQARLVAARWSRCAGRGAGGDTLPSMPAIAAARSTRPSVLRRSFAFAAVALIACAAVLSWPALRLQLEADHLTGTAETRTLRLEDGSLATARRAERRVRQLHGRPARNRAAGGQCLLRGRAVGRPSLRRACGRRRGDGGRHRLRRADQLRVRSRCRSSPASCVSPARQALRRRC